MWKSHKKLNDLNSVLFRSTTGTLKTFSCDNVQVEDHPFTKKKVLVRRCSILNDGDDGNMHCVLKDGEYVSCFDKDKQPLIIEFFGLEDKSYDGEKLNIFTGFLKMKEKLAANIILITKLRRRLADLKTTNNTALEAKIKQLTAEKKTELAYKDELYDDLQKEKEAESKTLQRTIDELEKDSEAKDDALNRLRGEIIGKYEDTLRNTQEKAQEEIDSLKEALDRLLERVRIPIPFPQVPESASPPSTP
jgi:hypothetical protein